MFKKKYRVIRRHDWANPDNPFVVESRRLIWPFWSDVPDRRGGYSNTNAFRTADEAKEFIEVDKAGLNKLNYLHKDHAQVVHEE